MVLLMGSVLMSLENLAIGYKKNNPVISNLNLQFQAGEFICLLGPNGSGKSTLLKTLLGLLPPLNGNIKLKGRSLEEYHAIDRAKVLSAMLTDQVNLDHLNVMDLVLLGRFPYRKGFQKLSEEDHKIAEQALKSVQAFKFSERNLDALSDGERQRVFIARALTQDPECMFLDEPTSFLDYPHRVETFQLMREWAHAHDKTVLMTSHDIDLTLNFADRIILLDEHGNVHDGAPEDLVLNGIFHKIFHSEHLHVNEEEGRFDVRMDTHKEIQLLGKGREYGWTIRALNRVGYKVTERANLVCEIFEGRWKLKSEAHQSEHTSLASLTRVLKSFE